MSHPVGAGVVVAVSREMVFGPGDTLVFSFGPGGVLDEERAARFEDDLGAVWRSSGDLLEHHEPPDALQIEIDERAAWASVVAVLESSQRASWRRAALIARGEIRQRAPPASEIERPLRRTSEYIERASGPLPRSDSRPATPNFLEIVYGRCPPARDIVVEVAWNERSKSSLATALPQAITSCGCRVDFASARSYHWEMAGRNVEPHLVAIVVELADPDDSQSRRVALPAETPWSAAIDEVAAAAALGGPLVLAVAEQHAEALP
jgi:hypothetical protein